MASFSDLPNELIVEIWSHILRPNDIENFALASKTIRTLGGKHLVDHRKLTRELSTFDIASSKSRFSAAGWLKEILTNPRVALYIKTVIAPGYFFHWKSEGVNTLKKFDPEAGEDGRQYRHSPYAEQDMELFKSTIIKAKQFFNFKKRARCGCFRDAKFTMNSLAEMMEEGNEIPIIVLLLLLFTNLKTIVIQDEKFDKDFIDLLRWISEGDGIPILKRSIKVKALNAHDKTAERFLRDVGSDFLPSSTNAKRQIPGTMSQDHCFSFDIRAWSMNVDGMWTL